ncbi:MAG: hypothetical protein VYB65_03410 [Myxococcota bacterium]|nr:hypothetical protein [Myxococcota bacterium]
MTAGWQEQRIEAAQGQCGVFERANTRARMNHTLTDQAHRPLPSLPLAPGDVRLEHLILTA